MSDWTETLTPAERREWERYIAHAREDIITKITGCAAVVSVVPPADDLDIKFCLELGASIMVGKPIVAVATTGCRVPVKLRQVADAVIEVGDVDTEEGQAELQRKMGTALKRLGIESK